MEATLSSAQLNEFEKNGYLIVRSVVAKDVCERMLEVTQEQVRDATAPVEYEAEVGYAGAPASLDAPGGRTIRRLRGAYDRDQCFRDWAREPGLISRLRQLLDEAVYLTLAHHNCVMTKHPSYGTATGWHRDIRYWSFTRPDLICVWLALDAENGSNGGLKFIPGSHRLNIAPHQLDELDFLRPELSENQALFAQGLQIELQQGDVVFFHSGLFHAAGRNGSARTKTSVAFAYHGASTKPIAGTRSAAAPDILIGS